MPRNYMQIFICPLRPLSWVLGLLGPALPKAEFEKDGVAKDLKSTQKELDKALAYQEHLKPVSRTHFTTYLGGALRTL